MLILPPTAIPNFGPTSSQELDDILLTLREKLFIPWSLAKQQRRLIWSPKNNEMLLNEPGITVELGDGERLKLMPADPFAIPNPRKEMPKILALMKQPGDWRNLMGLLEGLKIAHQVPPLDHMEKIVRKAHESGKVGTIIQCAERVHRTGLSLKNPSVFEEVMLAYHTKAQNAGWKGEEVDRALRQAEHAVFMLEAKEHKPKSKDGTIDPRRKPEVVGILLELAAVRSVRNLDKVDQGQKVADYVAKVLALWPNGNFSKNEEWMAANKQLEMCTPLWLGLAYALQVQGMSDGVGVDMLQQRYGELDAVLREAKALVESKAGKKDRRGLQLFNAALAADKA